MARETVGKYELLTRIGEGGMADVFLARQLGPENFEKLVVIKRIHPHLARLKIFTDMFLDEARIAAQVNHPNVVQIFELGEADGCYFIAMEYLAGESLATILARSLRSQKPIAPHEVARVIADALAGLHAAHELRDMRGQPLEIVHRDISPSNIVVLYDGLVKLVDFGIAKARGRLAETTAGQVKGKFAYISPEQLTSKPVDRRADIFGIGIVLWESLALRRLFKQDSDGATVNAVLSQRVSAPSTLRADVPPELDRITLKALSRHPAERFQTALEMREALEELLHRRPTRVTAQTLKAMMHESFADRVGARESLLHDAQAKDNWAELQEAWYALSGAGQDTMEMPLAEGTTALKDHPSMRSRSDAVFMWVPIAVVLAIAGAWALLGRDRSPTEAPPVEAQAIVEPVQVKVSDPPPEQPEEPPPPKQINEAPKEERAPTVRRSESRAIASKRTGRLFLATMPRSKVFFGKRELGLTPLVNVPLPAGDYDLTAVQTDSGAKKTIRVHIAADQETRLLQKL